MANVEKLQSTTGIFDYPDASDPSKGTTEQQYQEWVKNHHNVLNDVVAAHLWQPSTAYKAGQVVVSPNMVANTVARVVAAGTSSSAEPVWRAAGNTVGDGTVTWAILYRTVDYATQAEVTAHSNTTKIVTPAMLGGTIQTDLASEKAGILNGTDKSVLGGVTGILPAKHGGTGVDSLDKAIVGLAKSLTGDNGLWDYLHRKGVNFALPSTNAAINALGMFLSSYNATGKITNQPSQYGQLLNIPHGRDTAESTQFWIEQNSGKLYHRGGNNANVLVNQKFKRFLDTDDVSTIGVVAGDVSNADAWWVKLGGTIPLIIQGGKIYKSLAVTFPISFNNPLGIWNSSYNYYETINVRDITQKTATLRCGGGNPDNIIWIAIGY